jgi:N-acetylglutamate synthase-like GNAT family acetyltransferase
MDIRPYTPSDREACLAVYDSNAPEFLPPDRRQSFAERLDSADPFYVAEHEGSIAGCGGYVLTRNTAHLQWGLVHRQWQRQGLGRFLLFYRMREVTKHAAVETVTLETPTAAAPFFASQGFREVARSESTVSMTKRLIVCA